MAKKRMTMEIDDDYVTEIMRRHHLRTKTEAVDWALRHVALLPMTKEEVLALQGTLLIDKIPDDEIVEFAFQPRPS